jgi:hypothetical protein
MMEGTADDDAQKKNKNGDDEQRNLPPPSSSSIKRLDVTWKTNPSSKKAKFDSNSNFSNGNFFESSHKEKEKPLTDYIYSIQTGGKIESSIVIEEVGPLVIPLVGKQHDDEKDEENEGSQSTKQKKGPLLSRHLSKDLINCKTDDDRFKLDIQSRPTDLHAKSTSYDNIPVESFGAALLRGMGWDGRTHAEMMKKKDGDKLNNRPFRLGLGADPKDLIDAAKGGNNKSQNSSSNSATDSKKEIERRRLKEQEKLKQQQSQRLPGMFLIGDFVFSNEIDRRGKVLQTQGVPGLSKIRIQVEHTGDITDVSKSSLKLLDNLEMKLNPIVFPEQNINESKTNELPATTTTTTQFFGLKNNPDHSQKAVKTGLADSDGNNPSFPGFATSTATNTTTTADSEKTKPMKQSEKKSDRPSWIRSGIRVKMVEKMKDTDNNTSKYYLQKGTILDVVSKGLAHIRFDNGGMEDVKEKYLETVLPLKGEKGMVLLGTNKGEVGTLLERDNQKESVVIQLSESLEVMEIDMDSIAAFRGDHMH